MRIVTLIAAVALGAAATPVAQVPPDVAAQLRQIGPVVDPAGTAKIYRPLHARPPYAAVTVTRDVSYGTDPRQTIDIFTAGQNPAVTWVSPPPPPDPLVPAPPPATLAFPPAPAPTGAPRPVLIYVAGGPGNKIEPVLDGDAFYDNIMLWAVRNGMTAVNVQRLATPGRDAADAAKDIGLVIDWAQKHIPRYGGDPARVFIWAHSAGNGPVGAYLAREQTDPAKGHGLKGAVLMGGTMNILQAANVPGLLKATIPLFVGAGEIDLPGAVAFVDALKNELCKANQCPTTMIFKDHSHMSAVFSPNTADETVTAPILKWMQSVK